MLFTIFENQTVHQPENPHISWQFTIHSFQAGMCTYMTHGVLPMLMFPCSLNQPLVCPGAANTTATQGSSSLPPTPKRRFLLSISFPQRRAAHSPLLFTSTAPRVPVIFTIVLVGTQQKWTACKCSYLPGWQHLSSSLVCMLCNKQYENTKINRLNVI